MVSKPLPILFSSDDNLLIYNYILFSATFVNAAKQKMVVKLAVKIIPMFQLLQKEPSLVVLQKVSQIPMRHQDFSQLQATRL